MKKKPIAILLCMAMLCSLLSMLSFATDGQEEATDDATTACTVCGSNPCACVPAPDPQQDEPQELAIMDRLLAAETLEALRTLLMAEENKASVSALTADELVEVKTHAETIYNAVSEPTTDETAVYNELQETLSVLSGEEQEGDPESQEENVNTVVTSYNLTINLKEVANKEVGYIFNIKGNDVDVTVAVKGGDSLTIKDLPVDEYTITPNHSWNWRETVKVEMDGSLTEKDVTATVTVTSNGNKQWFNGYAYWPTAE